MDLSIFAELYNRHHSQIFEHFQHPKKKTGAITPNSHPSPYATMNQCSTSIDLPFLATSYNHTMHGLFSWCVFASPGSHITWLPSPNLLWQHNRIIFRSLSFHSLHFPASRPINTHAPLPGTTSMHPSGLKGDAALFGKSLTGATAPCFLSSLFYSSSCYIITACLSAFPASLEKVGPVIYLIHHCILRILRGTWYCRYLSIGWIKNVSNLNKFTLLVC